VGNTSLTTIPVVELQFTSLATITLLSAYEEVHEKISVPSFPPSTDLVSLSPLSIDNETVSGQQVYF